MDDSIGITQQLLLRPLSLALTHVFPLTHVTSLVECHEPLAREPPSWSIHPRRDKADELQDYYIMCLLSSVTETLSARVSEGFNCSYFCSYESAELNMD